MFIACTSIGTLPTAAASAYTHWMAIPVGSLVLVGLIFLLGTRVDPYEHSTDGKDGFVAVVDTP